ncbi:MAG: DUF362 domain-containing protein [Armatimonadota bacterium]|nr:MAG: DUF362 domain-containing protein [Armatimonadota bacterium]
MARKHSDDSDLTRRQFLRRGAGGLLGAVVGGAAASQGGCRSASQSASESAVEERGPTPGRATVALIRDQRALDGSPEARETILREMLDQALVRLTGAADQAAAWKTYGRAGEKIAIKSNVMMRPVHPELLYAIHSGLTSAGVADKDIAAWDRNSAGFGRDEFEALPQRPGYDADDVSNLVTWADGLVNVTGLKAHWLAGVGCALKNWAGAVTNINVSDRNVTYAFHADSCAETGILNAIPSIRERCRLIVIDALQPLFNGGPQVDPRYVWDYRGLIVGTDPVAVDMICARVVQAKRDEYKGYEWPISPPAKHVQIADAKYGLGVSDPERIDLVKLGWSDGVLV